MFMFGSNECPRLYLSYTTTTFQSTHCANITVNAKSSNLALASAIVETLLEKRFAAGVTRFATDKLDWVIQATATTSSNAIRRRNLASANHNLPVN